MNTISAATTDDGKFGFVKITKWERAKTEPTNDGDEPEYDLSPDGIIYFSEGCWCPFCGENTLYLHAADAQDEIPTPLINFWGCDNCQSYGSSAEYICGEGTATWDHGGIFPEAFVVCRHDRNHAVTKDFTDLGL